MNQTIDDTTIREWADRHDLQGSSVDLRCIFEDARTIQIRDIPGYSVHLRNCPYEHGGPCTCNSEKMAGNVLFDFDFATTVLTNVCQLIHGWHSDGSWSEWDEQVYKDASELSKRCNANSSYSK